jgi:hypothetical protein
LPQRNLYFKCIELEIKGLHVLKLLVKTKNNNKQNKTLSV